MSTRGRERIELALVLGLALGLRLADAAFQSLHLDDFHSLYHARAASLGEFFLHLRQDNHPPLFFLLLRGLRGLFGEQEFLLRLPAVLAGAATVPLVWRMGRRFSARGARLSAALWVACSSLNLELSADLRMYSLLTLALAGLLDASLDLLEGERGLARALLWTVVGLHTHYHFVHALAVIVASALALAWAYPATRPGVRRLLASQALAALCCLPWFLWGFPVQLGHGLPPGGSAVSPQLFLEGLVHMIYINVRLLGPVARLGFLAAGAVTLGLALLAAVRLVWRERSTPEAPAWFLLLAAGFLLPTWSALAAWITPRAGFEWRYIAGAVSPLALLAARGAYAPGPWSRARRAAASCAVAAAFVLCLANVRDPGREDNRAAVRDILARARPGDAIVAPEWQPRLFPHSGAWSFYAPRFRHPGQELPQLLPFTDDFAFPPDTDLSPYARVFFMGRSIPNDVPLLRQLRAEFPRERAQAFGLSIWVLTFERD